jgi:hypothetical protein
MQVVERDHERRLRRDRFQVRGVGVEEAELRDFGVAYLLGRGDKGSCKSQGKMRDSSLSAPGGM